MTADSRRLTTGTALASVLLALTLGAIYLWTLLPEVGYSGDTAKFQFLGYVLGTPHATGYPTYLVLNHLFTRFFPFGSLAYKANLLSAVFAVLAAILFFRLLLELRISLIVAWVTTVAFGLTPTLWLESIVAEVYTLHLLFMTAVMLLFVRWHRSRRDRDLLLGCFLYALSFGNHLLSITLLPALGYLVWVTDRRVLTDGRKLAWIALFIVIGVLQYTYVFWRTADPTAIYVEMRPTNLQEFLWYMTGARFRSLMFAFTLGEVVTQRIPMFLGLLWRQFLVTLPLAVYGLLRFGNRQINTFLLLALAGTLIYALNYDIQEIFVYFLPGYMIVAIYLGKGLEALKVALEGRRVHIHPVVFAVIPVVFLAANLSSVSQRNSTDDARRTEQILEVAGQDALIVSPNYHYTEFLLYYLLGYGQEDRNIYVMHPFAADAATAYVMAGQPVHLPAQRKDAPAGLKLVVADVTQVDQLKAAGLSLKPAGSGLFVAETPVEPR